MGRSWYSAGTTAPTTARSTAVTTDRAARVATADQGVGDRREGPGCARLARQHKEGPDDRAEIRQVVVGLSPVLVDGRDNRNVTGVLAVRAFFATVFLVGCPRNSRVHIDLSEGRHLGILTLLAF